MSDIYCNNRGFTLIEVIAVLAAICIVAAVAIAKAVPASQSSTIAEDDILKANLRFAQLKALQDDGNGNTDSWGIFFNGNSYTLYNNGTTAPVKLPGESSATHNFSGGVTAASPSPNPVSFNSWGSPVDTSGNPLASNLVISLSNSAGSASVTVTSATGFIP